MYRSESTGIFSNSGHCYHYPALRRFSHVPNLVQEVTALRWDDRIN